VPTSDPSRPPSAASNRSGTTSAGGRAGTTTSAGGRAGTTNEPSTSRAGTTDGGGELSEFGDMGAAARSYGGGKGEGGRPPAVPLETVPRLQDRNPYRLRHGLVVYDRSAANSGEWRGGGAFKQITSVGDPDPEVPYVFRPPGSASGSVRHKYGSGAGSFHDQAKIVRKSCLYCFVTSFRPFIFEE
jgi:hypothetical protein